MLTQQEAWEADRCFQHVCDTIRLDGVSPRSVLFGSTLLEWLQGGSKITIACEPPHAGYKRVELPVSIDEEVSSD